MKIWINEIQTKGESYTEVNLESVGSKTRGSQGICSILQSYK